MTTGRRTRLLVPPAVLRDEEAAAYIGLAPHTLKAWRHRGQGPPFVQYGGRCVRYRVRDLDAWLAEHLQGAEDADAR